MKRKNKFLQSPFMTFGYTVFVVWGYGLLYIVYFSSISSIFVNKTLFAHIISILFLGIFPTIILIFYIHRGASIIEISETGIKKTLFKIFYKREIKWEELAEMKIILQVNAWLIASKVPMGKYNYNQLMKRKDIIPMTFSKKLYYAIREYSNQEIIGLKEDKID